MIVRPRRLRTTAAMRDLVAQTRISPKQLMLPIFIKEGISEPVAIDGMPGVFQQTEESFLNLLDDAVAAGIKSVMLFGVPLEKDELGSGATDPDGLLNRSVRKAKERVGDKLVIVADLCLDEFTSHGHCGVLASDGSVDNDATLEIYAEMGNQLALAGADMLGLSGMMDGQVSKVRDRLDQAGQFNTAVLAYAAKYASNFYGPFRNAVESELVGDRKTYQQDYRNQFESTREIELDIEQGADVIMVKPALAYLDVVAEAARISNVPVASYIVSGELAMIELAAKQQLLNRQQAILEVVYSCARAGASIICTYWALEVANWVKEEN
jgi:porphobilinogen synthase